MVLAGRGDFSRHLSTAGRSSDTALSHTTKTNDTDITTNVDLSNEDVIVSIIKKNFPSHKIIGEEESSTSGPVQQTSEPTWIIDPIDGTTNFAAGNPLCCVSVGFVEDGVSKVGVVYSGLGELFVGVEGYGAYYDGVRITRESSGVEEVVGENRGSQLFFDAGENEEDLDHKFAVPQTLSSCNVCVEFGYERGEYKTHLLTNHRNNYHPLS